MLAIGRRRKKRERRARAPPRGLHFTGRQHCRGTHRLRRRRPGRNLTWGQSELAAQRRASAGCISGCGGVEGSALSIPCLIPRSSAMEVGSLGRTIACVEWNGYIHTYTPAFYTIITLSRGFVCCVANGDIKLITYQQKFFAMFHSHRIAGAAAIHRAGHQSLLAP